MMRRGMHQLAGHSRVSVCSKFCFNLSGDWTSLVFCLSFFDLSLRTKESACVIIAPLQTKDEERASQQLGIKGSVWVQNPCFSLLSDRTSLVFCLSLLDIYMTFFLRYLISFIFNFS